MACLSPLPAFWSREVSEKTGRRQVLFKSGSDVLMPLDLPCGKCIGCRMDKSRIWSIRCYHESQMHSRNCFVTLTYDDAHLPADALLDREHPRQLWKDLRNAGFKFRYFGCGEYGFKTSRPHYHAIIFGQDFRFDAVFYDGKCWISPTLTQAWGRGQVLVAPVEMASICYVAGYVQKKAADFDTFNFMSRQPGIGATWLARYADDIRRTGFCVIEGRRLTVPSYYLERGLEDVKQRRRLAAMKRGKLDYYQRAAKSLNLERQLHYRSTKEKH